MINYVATWRQEMKLRNLNGVQCFEDENKRVLVKGIWKIYFYKLFNGSDTKYWSELSNLVEDRKCRFI